MKKIRKMKIGSYLVKNGYLTLNQAQSIIKEQASCVGPNKERFGRIAINRGFISEKVLNKIILQKEKQEFGF